MCSEMISVRMNYKAECEKWRICNNWAGVAKLIRNSSKYFHKNAIVHCMLEEKKNVFHGEL